MDNNDQQSGNDLTGNETGKNKGPLSKLHPLFFVFFALTLVFFLYQIVGGVISYLMLGEGMEINQSNLNLTRVLLSFAQFMFILAPAIVLVMLQDNNIRDTFRLYKPKWSVFFLSIAGMLAIQPFLQMYLYFQNEFVFSLPFGSDAIKQLKDLFDMLESTTEKLVTANNIPEFLLILFVIAFTPAICEEFLFRGLVFKNFGKIMSPAKSFLFTGLLFALFHFHPFNLIPLAILGIYLTFIVYHSGSIYTAVVSHFINNLLSAAAVFYFGTETLNTENITPQEKNQLLIFGVLSLLVFIVIIFFITKNSAESDMENKIKHKDDFFKDTIANE